MNKKIKGIVVAIIAFILFMFIKAMFNVITDPNPKKTNNKDPNYYLTSPWVTESVGWFFMSLPEKWSENNTEIEKNQSRYDEISNDVKMYELKLKDFFLACMYMDAKDGIYQNWGLDQSAKATANQILYNLDCKDITLEKLPPLYDPLEVNYTAHSDCNPHNYKARIKGIRYENHILLIGTYFKESDSTLNILSNRIINSIHNKYPEVAKKK